MKISQLVYLSTLILLAACAGGDRREDALRRVQNRSSAVPGLSVEQAVEELLKDLQSVKKQPVESRRWYANRAIEFDKDEVYKIGYEYAQGGVTTRLGWVYHYRADRLEALTESARQIHP